MKSWNEIFLAEAQWIQEQQLLMDQRRYASSCDEGKTNFKCEYCGKRCYVHGYWHQTDELRDEEGEPYYLDKCPHCKKTIKCNWRYAAGFFGKKYR